MKKYLTELTNEELKIVFTNNQVIQDNVYENIYETESQYVGEILEIINDGNVFSNYSIDGDYGRSFINVNSKKYYEFFNNLIDAIRSYNFLSTNLTTYKDVEELHQDLLNKAKKGMDYAIARDDVTYEGEVYDELNEKLEALIDEVVAVLINSFENILKIPNEEDAVEKFITSVRELEYYDEVYILEDSKSYIAYEDITRTLQ